MLKVRQGTYIEVRDAISTCKGNAMKITATMNRTVWRCMRFVLVCGRAVC
jgi:hypothetical protein